MKNTVNEMKNTLEGINSRLNDIEEQISEELKDRIVESTEAKKIKEKRMKRNEDSLRANTKHSNIPIIRVPKGVKRDRECI